MRTVRRLIQDSRHSAKQIDRLHKVIDDDGGPDAIKACGQPVSLIGFQSTVAWFVNLNVGNVGFRRASRSAAATRSSCSSPTTTGGRCASTTCRAPVKAKCDQLEVDSDFG